MIKQFLQFIIGLISVAFGIGVTILTYWILYKIGRLTAKFMNIETTDFIINYFFFPLLVVCIGILIAYFLYLIFVGARDIGASIYERIELFMEEKRNAKVKKELL